MILGRLKNEKCFPPKSKFVPRMNSTNVSIHTQLPQVEHVSKDGAWKTTQYAKGKEKGSQAI